MFFSVITKNLNREILTNNLVAFKRWYGVRIKNFNIIGVHWKIRFLGDGVTKNLHIYIYIYIQGKAEQPLRGMQYKKKKQKITAYRKSV